MEVRITANLDQLLRGLDAFAQRQLPFAAAHALNDLAGEVQGAEEAALRAGLDRPTGFTQRAIYRRAARKTQLEAEIGIRPIQAGYLVWQIEGGRRRPKRRAIPVPVGVVRNAHGNMPKRALARMLARPDVFIASAGSARAGHLPPGIYKRGKSKRGRGTTQPPLELLVAFETSATYAAKPLDFFGLADRTVRARYRAHLERRLAEAIRTAR
ncbi:hypothetical protein [Xinfangfangia pollutisoli]|uniref:hypothetical protein n=1 Tax=Xinfangfangia pollutisoli TaxID=2865960 RepID=UPI001CD1D0EA|nr:hypothetical protein [Xinfangfangia pollutisoli]